MIFQISLTITMAVSFAAMVAENNHVGTK